MVGRSCRRFGLCKGKVYVKSGMETLDKTGGKEYLARNDDIFDEDEGMYIAEALFNKYPLITNAAMKKQVVGLTSDPVLWRVLRREFAKKNDNVLKFLRDKNYKPTV
jgi:hypothetical protein